ncbi:ubiquitin carboxyl-terminal hydrolase 24-like [Dioscorea cayenensis subsp. rotundata]|uniref:ubiquitinyl hydrolase 1 n=1 Tax=Dioscorea cayennensis subsp. rotundata TaxID=55577 RepID=A0AB40AUB3_DIOCR|nr:ubiquitin carboxyl-terminal hydrolase 24-like [Dioscorea cayenensis subsp. rotundata]
MPHDSENADPFLEIVQPFLVLHLNITSSSVHTIEDSLRLHFGIKNNEGYRSSEDYEDKNSAGKSTKIEKLPRILILHLMRFSFENSGSGFVKFDKPVKFPSDLEIENDLLASPAQHQRILYELVGSVTHHGSKSSIGHYTADIKYPDGPWMSCDDERSHLLARAMFSTIRLIFFCMSDYVVVIALVRAKYSINRESLSLGK